MVTSFPCGVSSSDPPLSDSRPRPGMTCCGATYGSSQYSSSSSQYTSSPSSCEVGKVLVRLFVFLGVVLFTSRFVSSYACVPSFPEVGMFASESPECFLSAAIRDSSVTVGWGRP